MRSLCSKAINNIHYLSSFYYCRLFPNRRNCIIIRTLMVPKIFCLSCLNSWRNLLDPVRKRQAVMRMKVDSNKGICPDFGRNVLGDRRDDHDELPLVDPSMNLPLCQLQELNCLDLVLLYLEFIMHLIESACTILLLTNLNYVLYNFFEGISDIQMRLLSIICEELPPLWEITNHLKIIWRDRGGELDI